jgi:ubiquitin carboxyl-terminal hydrolase 1
MGRDKRDLAGDVPVLVGPEPLVTPESADGEEGAEEEPEEPEEEPEESDSRSRNRSKGKGKANSTTTTTTTMTNGFADPYSAYSHFSSQSSSSSFYHWQDRSETLSGSGKGWLRISDDSVGECGIENVLAEGSAAFMLYYERAVWGGGGMDLKEKGREKTPTSGVLNNRMNGGGLDMDDLDMDMDGDADRFSIGSEETLRPKMKVVDLNGSVGSLVSEVGVGIMKQKKDHGKGNYGLRMKDKVRDRESQMSLSINGNLYASSVSSSPNATSSKIFGPRIVRSVNARRSHSVGTNGSAIPVSEVANGVGSLVNGTTKHGSRDDQEQDEYDTEDVSWNMTASAPSVLQVSNLTNNSSSTAIDKTCIQIGLGSQSTKVMMHHVPATTTNSVGAR